MIAKLTRIIIAVLFIIPLLALPVLAQTYYADILFSETAGNTYTMYPALTPLNVTNLISQNYISASGLDTRVTSGGTEIPHLLGDDKLLFARSLRGY